MVVQLHVEIEHITDIVHRQHDVRMHLVLDDAGDGLRDFAQQLRN